MPRGSAGQIGEDKARASEAFDMQVRNGEVEKWMKETWVDAWLRGHYDGLVYKPQAAIRDKRGSRRAS